MKKLQISLPAREYDIIIEKGILSKAGNYIRKVTDGKKITIVTDTNVGPIYAKDLAKVLMEQDFSVHIIEIPAGEESKCQEQLFYLYDEMLEFGMTRTDLIVALGGGVVGDLTGFAASTLYRGIPFVQIPTTILSQVDSSVGGKVAIDLPKGKNLVGAFYQPKLVLIDPLCLETLPSRYISDGMAEVIKYGAIMDEDLFSFIEGISTKEELLDSMEEIVYLCCDKKRQVVEEDELDTGLRMILNFGHTFGHAIEKQGNYQVYTHGEAVAVGMVMACRYGEKIGLTKSGTRARMEEVLQRFRLPVSAEISKDVFLQAISHDKKGSGNLLNLILLKEIGKVEIVKTNKEDVWK